ncbi:Hypothetical predicted protein, partial [Marmota monax]
VKQPLSLNGQRLQVGRGGFQVIFLNVAQALAQAGTSQVPFFLRGVGGERRAVFRRPCESSRGSPRGTEVHIPETLHYSPQSLKEMSTELNAS